MIGHLDDPVDDITLFGFMTGWRKGDILPLPWEAVDRKAREIRLGRGDTKTGASRILAYSEGDALDRLIEKRWAAREYEDRDSQAGISTNVFHRRGRRLVDIRKAWNTACKDAKLAGRRFHDLRRSAARDMVRAGVPETVAMSVTGHRTRSMFDRYDITTGDDQRAALKRTAAHRADLKKSTTRRDAMPSKENVVPLPAGGRTV